MYFWELRHNNLLQREVKVDRGPLSWSVFLFQTSFPAGNGAGGTSHKGHVHLVPNSSDNCQYSTLLPPSLKPRHTKETNDFNVLGK